MSMFTELISQEKSSLDLQSEVESVISSSGGSIPDTWKWFTDSEGRIYFLEKNSNRKRYGKLINCECCQRQICVRVNSTHKTCSQTCSATLTQAEKLKLNCGMCKKDIYRKQSKLSVSKSRLYFCDRKCKEQAQQIGGLKEIQPDHYGEGTSRYADRAFKMYGVKCVDCNISFKPMLSVYHIDGNRENGAIENLEVVCNNHHLLRHMVFDEIKNNWLLNYKFLTPRNKLKEIMNLLN
jgi:hypothetical protein